MQEQNIKIKFLLVPYHPIVFNTISNNNKYKNVLLTEIFIREFAAENSITTTGSLDPKRINFDNSFFYDGMHCNEKGIRKNSSQRGRTQNLKYDTERFYGEINNDLLLIQYQNFNEILKINEALNIEN